ncbi:3-phosphoshikimate 1-carboxyvinyltransferase [Paenisporosarcina cavernae]|uniref:3-phosphoshikimate 1-carboxyvinyltransferase n=1 Tax=Paenisporosarcina cavernae TaxID=2320858 RepID=A0A385YWD6_9BACL|nr:3-phosphoshikimate 1-carboxyvinyltransferase [Paenisporosarcina cavernae]AYC30781.1 3-phosphoshikimate 1-carboxyvinyltransferase [Paenisporosarcina cavernae]
MEKTLYPLSEPLNGSIQIPGDKSISHRAIMFGSVAKGETIVSNFLPGADCLSTIDCFRKLGVQIDQQDTTVTISSEGFHSFKEPAEILDTGNSGTTTRLLTGLLAGSSIFAVIKGDESISKRPMGRVTNPLRKMGAIIHGREEAQFTPLAISGTKLQGINYTMPVASAQVKSAILLAGLHSESETVLQENVKTRDHTEKMMEQFGVDIKVVDNTIHLKPAGELHGRTIEVPGDISSAAFFLVAGAITPNSSIELKNVGLNDTRTGILDILQAMNATYKVTPQSVHSTEPVGTISIEYSALTGTTIDGSFIPRLIDEIPVIALMATQAVGKTIIKDAEELKVKETNRIDAVVTELKKLGATIEATEDGMIIEGPTPLHGGTIQTYGDHRIAMMASIASLISSDPITIDNYHCINVSYPTFFDHIEKLTTK